MTQPPEAVGKDNKPLVKEDPDSYDEELAPVTDAASAHAMNLNQQNRLEIDPGWCYGRQEGGSTVLLFQSISLVGG
jgi:hypothetical protein